LSSTAITWQDLLEVYRNTRWSDVGDCQLFVANKQIVATLKLVENSDRAQHDGDISPLVNVDTIEIGKTIPLRVGQPQLRLGVLADDWDGLIGSPEARLREPSNYFVKYDSTHSGTIPPTDEMLRYRAMLRFVAVLGKAALFTDPQKASIVFFKEQRIEIPLIYEARDLHLIDCKQVGDLEKTFDGDLHTEQKFGMLAEAVAALVVSQSPKNRLVYLAQNINELVKRITEGYKLFASSFSYSKMRGEVEKTQSEYVGRIHKTFSDIQGQILGLPVASLVVATQLRPARVCDVFAFANFAVIAGGWLFAILLIASCLNQWLTLNAIAQEIKDQRRKLDEDFREIKDTFSLSFDAIGTRIFWHRGALIVIVVVALLGGVFASRIYSILTDVSAWRCIIEI
jgi:hypothetical protein